MRGFEKIWRGGVAFGILLDRGVTIDLRGASDRSPLMAAVTGGQTAMVRWRLRQGADPRLKDQDAFTPLMLGVRELPVEVRDTATGTSREWISGVPANAHDPVALVEDSATDRRYTASPDQRFKSADGTEYIISDVRPNQLVIEEAATGAVQTIPLRGPRG